MSTRYQTSVKDIFGQEVGQLLCAHDQAIVQQLSVATPVASSKDPVRYFSSLLPFTQILQISNNTVFNPIVHSISLLIFRNSAEIRSVSKHPVYSTLPLYPIQNQINLIQPLIQFLKIHINIIPIYSQFFQVLSVFMFMHESSIYFSSSFHMPQTRPSRPS